MGFKDAFSEESEKELDVGPKAWQKYINANAPEDTHYVHIGNSQYQLIPDKGELEFQTKVTVPEDLKHIKIKDANDFDKLIYRAQRELEIDVSDIKANQKSITIDQLVVGFNKEIMHEHDKFFLIPRPFKPPITLTFKMNENEYSFKFQQIPYPSLTKIIFESIDSGIFYFKLTFHEDIEKTDIQLNYNFSKAKDLDYIYNNKQMITDFATGKIDIFKKSVNVFNEDVQIEINKILNFFLKLYSIKDFFHAKFDMEKNISTLDAFNLQRMYYSFIENKYYFDNEKISKYEMISTSDFDLPEKLPEDQKFAMIGYTTEKITILGQSLELIEQFTFKVASYAAENNKNFKKGDSIHFNVEGDQIIYKKLMRDAPKNIDFNDIAKELDNSIGIDIDNI
ncbi:TPA: abortive infection system toxin AbiGii family protein [Listeria monocytogenes]